ncbi:GIY-YIG nuclease family protein [Paenibacillus sp. LMG 31456]|uniref:GIY-YIG nuclease family protein n=1 Tax=Paenibacillus foliorum TaxID=2654974 RepID=A0A972K045_9BACL|nr:GIY-YIG nuclease family protein [Paenibacillus foliorum]NOU94266.1 GIY-YIG nuclease family protein [Paenibacillus foliorum]
MDRRKELVQQYKELKTEAGIYQIKNIINQKILIASTNNLKSLNGKTLMLKLGSHRNLQLQKEWNEFGEAAFVIEVLEVLVKKEGYFDEKDELKKLEEKWLHDLQPFDNRGYNKINNINNK